MRYSDGAPDAHDMLIDRPESLTRQSEPKVTVSVPLSPGQDDDLTSYGFQNPDAVRAHAAARAIEDSPEYLAAEQDADYQVKQLERHALHIGGGYLLGLMSSLIAQTHEKHPDHFASLVGEEGAARMLADVLPVERALRAGRAAHADRIIIDQTLARTPPLDKARKHYVNWRERFYAERGMTTGRA